MDLFINGYQHMFGFKKELAVKNVKKIIAICFKNRLDNINIKYICTYDRSF